MSARFVLGLGGTVDYEIEWDTNVLERLVGAHGLTVADVDGSRPIHDERDLLCTLLALVRDGVGGERFVASSDVVTGFAAHFGVRVTLGGTCVRAALAMGVVGLPATVHLVSVDDTVRRLLPASVSWMSSAVEDTLDPHLIVQFPAGARVRLADGEVVAPHANRIIYVNDPPNRDLVIADAFGDAVADADVTMISGFNVMQDGGLLDDRLATVRASLERRPAHGIVYFEDAGYHVPEFATRVRDALADVVDVWAMNEDELGWWLGRDVDLLDAADVAKAMSELADVVPARVRVVHSRHWALAHGADAHRFRRSLRGGITMAATRYGLGDGFDARDLGRTWATAPGERAAELARSLERESADVVCEPGLVVDTPAPTTIGLGDTFVGGFLAALAPDDGPVALPANQPPARFYRGGDRISAFRGRHVRGTHEPEDWVASTTTLFGDRVLGLSRLADGRLLADAVAADPERWLGPRHVAVHGSDPGLLVKLLDAGQRLPVHAHPDVPFAEQHLGLTHGKTEAWIALEPAAVHLGFARDVTADELAGWVGAQDVPAMLGAMHRLEIARGDAVLVPAGVPHAIGEGAFVVELQEPTDLSILLEWDGFDIDGRSDGHLDLGFEVALGAIDRGVWSPGAVAGLVRTTRQTEGALLPGAERFFRAERWRSGGRWDAGFAVVVVVAGQGALVDRAGRRTELHAGTTLVVPHVAGELVLTAEGAIEVLRCRPPGTEEGRTDEDPGVAPA